MPEAAAALAERVESLEHAVDVGREEVAAVSGRSERQRQMWSVAFAILALAVAGASVLAIGLQRRVDARLTEAAAKVTAAQQQAEAAAQLANQKVAATRENADRKIAEAEQTARNAQTVSDVLAAPDLGALQRHERRDDAPGIRADAVEPLARSGLQWIAGPSGAGGNDLSGVAVDGNRAGQRRSVRTGPGRTRHDGRPGSAARAAAGHRGGGHAGTDGWAAGAFGSDAPRARALEPSAKAFALHSARLKPSRSIPAQLKLSRSTLPTLRRSAKAFSRATGYRRRFALTSVSRSDRTITFSRRSPKLG